MEAGTSATVSGVRTAWLQLMVCWLQAHPLPGGRTAGPGPEGHGQRGALRSWAPATKEDGARTCEGPRHTPERNRKQTAIFRRRAQPVAPPRSPFLGLLQHRLQRAVFQVT